MRHDKYKVVLVWEFNGSPPLTFGCLKAYVESVKKLAQRVEILIREVNDFSAIDEIADEHPDLVGFSCYGDISTALQAAGRLKSNTPNLRVVCGGPSVSAYRIEELFGNGILDFAVHGEGEETFKDLLFFLLNGVPKLPDLPGLSFLRDGEVIVNPKRDLIRNLNSIPSPYLSGIFDLGCYQEIYLETSRGCPFHCRYCAQAGEKIRYFSTERVVREIQFIISRMPRLSTVYLADTDFFFNKKRAKSLLNKFRKIIAERDVKFQFETNACSLDDGIMRLLNSDKFSVGMGVQSINQMVLRTTGRFFSVRETKEKIDLFRRVAPKARLELSLILGLPGETPETFLDGVDWTISTGGTTDINILGVISGTEFGRDPARFGLVCEDRYLYQVISTQTFPKEAMERMISLTRRLDFLWRLMRHDRYVRQAVIYLGNCFLNSVPRPFLYICERLMENIEKCGEFDPLIDKCNCAPVQANAEGGFDENWITPYWRLKFLNAISDFGNAILQEDVHKQELKDSVLASKVEVLRLMTR